MLGALKRKPGECSGIGSPKSHRKTARHWILSRPKARGIRKAWGRQNQAMPSRATDPNSQDHRWLGHSLTSRTVDRVRCRQRTNQIHPTIQNRRTEHLAILERHLERCALPQTYGISSQRETKMFAARCMKRISVLLRTPTFHGS